MLTHLLLVAKVQCMILYSKTENDVLQFSFTLKLIKEMTEILWLKPAKDLGLLGATLQSLVLQLLWDVSQEKSLTLALFQTHASLVTITANGHRILMLTDSGKQSIMMCVR